VWGRSEAQLGENRRMGDNGGRLTRLACARKKTINRWGNDSSTTTKSEYLRSGDGKWRPWSAKQDAKKRNTSIARIAE